MEQFVPYRNKALQQKRKKEQQVYVVELRIPRWLPAVLVLAAVGKCSHIIIKRIVRRNNIKKLQDGKDPKTLDRAAYFKEHHISRTQSCFDRGCEKLHAYDRSVSLPVYRERANYTDSAKDDSSYYGHEDSSYYGHEDSLSEFSRIPSPREREDDDSQLTQFELYDSYLHDFVESPYNGLEHGTNF